MDMITIANLELRTRIGVPEEERKTAQRVRVTVEFATDARAVAAADDAAKGIDYARVAEDIRTLAKTERRTLERLAEDIAGMIVKKHAADRVTVTVTKFPPIGSGFVSLTIQRPQIQ